MKIGLLVSNPKTAFNYGAAIFERTFTNGLKKKKQKVITLCPDPVTSEKLKQLPELAAALIAESLIEHKQKAKKCDVLYATNWNAVGYVGQGIPLVTTFHCTFNGILKIIGKEPESPDMEEKDIWEKYVDQIKTLSMSPAYLIQKGKENTALVENFVAQHSTRVVAVSERVKAEMVSYFHLPADKIVVIENGIPRQWFIGKNKKCPQCEPKIKKWRELKKPILIWLARIGTNESTFKTKGLDRALEVMSQIKDAHKVIISFTSRPERYRELFAPYGVEFISNWPYEHLPHLMRAGDIFIQTSRYEGFGLTLLEAMISSLACVSFPVGVATEVIKDGSSGFLSSTTSEMIEKINYLIKHPAKRRQMGKRAALLGKKNYRLTTMVDKYIKLFKEIKKQKK